MEAALSHNNSKLEFLNDLSRRSKEICSIVQNEFKPLDQAARSTQPMLNEWCVDQCFEHLVLTFEMNLPQAVSGLERGKGAGSVEWFKPTWIAGTQYYRQMFSPSNQVQTMPKVNPNTINPSEHYYPDVYERFLAQKGQKAAMLDQAQEADLQVRCWALKVVPLNLGDYLEQFVLHDELYLDQASRVLPAYQQSLSAA